MEQEGKTVTQVPEIGNSHLSHWVQVQHIYLDVGEHI